MSFELTKKCSKYFTYKDLIECGETQSRLGFKNLPIQERSFEALAELALNILDPLVEKFGELKLTYGFCSPGLAKKIPSNIAPKIDQHSSWELNSKGNLICERGGAAVDFIIPNTGMLEVAKWLTKNIEFDRLYFYGDKLPVHVSYGPDGTGQIVLMTNEKNGRLIPRVISNNNFSSFS